MKRLKSHIRINIIHLESNTNCSIEIIEDLNFDSFNVPLFNSDNLKSEILNASINMYYTLWSLLLNSKTVEVSGLTLKHEFIDI